MTGSQELNLRRIVGMKYEMKCHAVSELRKREMARWLAIVGKLVSPTPSFFDDENAAQFRLSRPSKRWHAL
jgi:hypothetical protein